MLHLGVIGAGGHARGAHLPALAHYREQHPDTIELTAICDPDPGRAAGAARDFGFRKIYPGIDELLGGERLDACLAFTPARLNAVIGRRLLQEGIPGLIEKPPGASAAEAEELAVRCAQEGGRLMVSVNRRFDPARAGALAWIGGRRIRAVRVLMARDRRTDLRFLEETGIHVLDAVRSVLGEPVRWEGIKQVVAGGQWWTIRLRFPEGIWANVELAPTTGSRAERFELFGADFRAEYCSAEHDQGCWRGWEESRLVAEEVIPPLPAFVANGTYAETVAFIDSLLGKRPFSPTPADVAPSVRLTESLAQSVP